MKVNMLIEEAKKQSPEKYFTLTYESLVTDPAGKSEEICAFLNLPYDLNMVENHQSGMYSSFNRNTNKGFLKVHQNVFKPINPKHIHDWEEKLSTEELASVEAVAGKFGEATYGYKPKGSIEMKQEKQPVSFMMDLKYRTIKALYHTALANSWLYYKIKQYVWRNF
jgi:hypothetical protein